jgi:hypothetical protein
VVLFGSSLLTCKADRVGTRITERVYILPVGQSSRGRSRCAHQPEHNPEAVAQPGVALLRLATPYL